MMSRFFWLAGSTNVGIRMLSALGCPCEGVGANLLTHDRKVCSPGGPPKLPKPGKSCAFRLLGFPLSLNRRSLFLSVAEPHLASTQYAGTAPRGTPAPA